MKKGLFLAAMMVIVIGLLANACTVSAPVVTDGMSSASTLTSTATPTQPALPTAGEPPISVPELTNTPTPTVTVYPTATPLSLSSIPTSLASEVILPSNANRLKVLRHYDDLVGTFVYLSPDWCYLAQVKAQLNQNGGNSAIYLVILNGSALLTGGADLLPLAGETQLSGENTSFQGLQFLPQGYLAITIYCPACEDGRSKTSLWMLPGLEPDPQSVGDPLLALDIGGSPIVFPTDGGVLGGASPDGHYLALSKLDEIILIDLFSMDTALLPVPKSGALAFSPNSQFLAVSVQETPASSIVKIIDLLSREVVRSLDEPMTRIASLAYSPVGSWLSVGGENEFLLWDVRQAGSLLTRAGVPGGSIGVVFSPDARTLVTVGNGVVVLWDVESSSQAATLTLPGQQIIQAVFSPDGSLLLTRTAGGLQVWALPPL